MTQAEPLVLKIRGGGDALVGKLVNGTAFEQVGPTLTGGGVDSTRSSVVYPHGFVIRFRGQLFAFSFDTGAGGRVNVYDEGGDDDWDLNRAGAGINFPRVSARGALSYRFTANENNQCGMSPLFEVVTEGGSYLVFTVMAPFVDDVRFHRYSPDDLSASVHGIWDALTPVDALGSANRSMQAFPHDGLLHAVYGNGGVNDYWSYNPVTNAALKYTRPFSITTIEHHYFFSLFDRLFLGSLDDSAAPHQSQVAEFVSGNWALSAAGDVRLGSVTSETRAAVFQIAIGKVLVIAFGSDLATGTTHTLRALLFDTVGGAKGGALQATDVTTDVIDNSGFSFPGGGAQGCFGYTSASDPLGTPRHFLYWCTDTGGPSTFIVYEVTDEVTPLALVGTSDITSDYAPPTGFYGGGERENGIDQATRLVTVSPRGWESGLTGLRVKCSAHGDALVIAHPAIAGKSLFHGAVTGGPFQVGETLTGGTSGATATAAGVGARALHATGITGAFVPGETVTGGTSGATCILSLPVLGNVVGYSNGETLTGGTSGATATLAKQPTAAFDDYMRHDAGLLDLTGVAGTFQVGETITGGTSAVARTLYDIQDAAYLKDEPLTGLSSAAAATIIGDGAAEGLYLRGASGTFTPGETVEGAATGIRTVTNTVLQHGIVTAGPFEVGEAVLGGTSGATGTITHLGPGGTGQRYVKLSGVVGTFVNGETLTQTSGANTGANAVLSAAPAGSHGGAADKTIRATYFNGSASGKGVPVSYCTLVAGSGQRCTVSKGTGPGGADEVVDVVADGTVGGDEPVSFEWDFQADGVPKFLASSLCFEIDRA